MPILPTPHGSNTNTPKTITLDGAPADSTQARPVDPFIEAGDVVWYVRPPSGGQFGPATGNIMRQWLAEGRISPGSLVWREGWRDWQQASVIFPQLCMVDPLAEIALADVPFMQPISSLVRQKSRQRNSQNKRKLVIILIILTVIILAGMFLWAFTGGSNSATDKSSTPSTRLELRDTFNSNRLL